MTETKNSKSEIYIVIVFNPKEKDEKKILKFSKELSKGIIETFPSDGFELAGKPTISEFYNNLAEEDMTGVGFAFAAHGGDCEYMDSFKGFLQENVKNEAYLIEIIKREIKYGDMDIAVSKSPFGLLKLIGVPKVESITEVDHYEYWGGKDKG